MVGILIRGRRKSTAAGPGFRFNQPGRDDATMPDVAVGTQGTQSGFTLLVQEPVRKGEVRVGTCASTRHVLYADNVVSVSQVTAS